MNSGSNDPHVPPQLAARASEPFDGAPGPLIEEDEGVDLRRIAAALLRYKWLVAGLGLVGGLAGFGLGRVVQPEFEAHATVQVPATLRGAPMVVSPIRSAPLLESRAWLELMRSFLVLDDVVVSQRLFVEPQLLADSALFRDFAIDSQFKPGIFRLERAAPGRIRLVTTEGQVLDEVAVGDSLGRPLGFRWVPPEPAAGASVGFQIRRPRDASVLLNNVLETNLPPDGSLVRMALRGKDPVKTASTLNAVASRFVTVATMLKREKLTGVTELLREQLSTAQADLRDAESALESFKVNTITLPSDRGATPIASGLTETRDPVRLAFFQLRIDRDALVRDRDAIRQVLAAQTDSGNSVIVGLGTINAARESAELQATLRTLTDKRSELRQLGLALAPTHPQLRAVRDEVEDLERRGVPTLVQQLLSNLDQRIRDYDQRIAASSREMQQIPVRFTEEARRQRRVDVNLKIFTELQAAYEQSRLAELSAAPDVRVLDFAVPPTRPVSDQFLILLIGGLIGGLGLGLTLAIVLDRLDRRIRYPNQVSRDLGLHILGAVPRQHEGGRVKAREEAAAHLQEAMRSIRLALTYAHGTAGSLVTTVTSPGSGDGKSFVSARLARSLALSGRRTLLIDGDTRRGALHRTFGQERKPGLLDVLAGTATRESAIRAVPDWGFDFIPCGTRRVRGPELLASSQMAQLLMSLRSEYSAIIIDSPPLGAGVDPLVLASLSGSLVMVVRTGVTDRELMEARLDDLERLPIRVLGAVLNDVEPQGVYRYYSYLPGYRAEDEDPREDTAAVAGVRLLKR